VSFYWGNNCSKNSSKRGFSLTPQGIAMCSRVKEGRHKKSPFISLQVPPQLLLLVLVFYMCQVRLAALVQGAEHKGFGEQSLHFLRAPFRGRDRLHERHERFSVLVEGSVRR